jgi:uroporphyrin-III C-methyltransferase/precorrin-2 dehydrogenase/sirohydrochlorin ferrochelatase
MQTFPMFLTMTGRTVIIAGGGEQAAQKARLIVRTTADIVLLTNEPDPELAGLAAAGRLRVVTDPAAADWQAAALVFIATGCPGLDAALQAYAKARGAAVVNVVDSPALCDAFTPAIVDRDPVVIAIGTEGTAPVLGRSLRARIEVMLEPRLGDLAALAGRLRDAVEDRVPKARRRAFWDWVFAGAPRDLAAGGALDQAAQTIKAALSEGGIGPQQGHIALVGAGPGAADLLTLRAHQRLQEADVIFYDRLVDPAVLDLARRDAERVFVGKAVGANAWPQDRISGVIVAAARQGRRVVRLKSGDPGIFGRATEELDAAHAAGIPVEIIPGVTAACAAGAALGRSLTQRGRGDTLVIATGTCRPGDQPPDWARHFHPGTTLALYMAAGAVGSVQDNLRAAGAPGACPVSIVSEAETARSLCRTGTLAGLADLARGLTGSTIILIDWPKVSAVAAIGPTQLDRDLMNARTLRAG